MFYRLVRKNAIGFCGKIFVREANASRLSSAFFGRTDFRVRFPRPKGYLDGA